MTRVGPATTAFRRRRVAVRDFVPTNFDARGPASSAGSSIRRVLPRGRAHLSYARETRTTSSLHGDRRQRRHALRSPTIHRLSERATFTLQGSYEHYTRQRRSPDQAGDLRPRLVRPDHRTRSRARRARSSGPGRNKGGQCTRPPKTLPSDSCERLGPPRLAAPQALVHLRRRSLRRSDGGCPALRDPLQQVQRRRRLHGTTTASGLAARVLVTGGAGAIGSVLVDALLARGDEVAVLDSFHEFYPRAQRSGTSRARARSAASRACSRATSATRGSWRVVRGFAPRRVAHLAARAGVRPSVEDPVTYADVNLVGTSVVLNAALRAGVERFVFASSSSVYGERPRGEFTEDWRPTGRSRPTARPSAAASCCVTPRTPPAACQSAVFASSRLRTAHAPRSRDPQVRSSCSPTGRFRSSATAASSATSRS